MELHDESAPLPRPGPLRRLIGLLRRLFGSRRSKRSEKPNIYPLY